MAIKGLAYVKTTWAFQERPLSSAKLNDWDDRIESAFELVHLLLSQAWGGNDGVLPGAIDGDLRVEALPVPGLAVEVRPGCAFISNTGFRLAETAQTPEIEPPQAQPRIDLVQARLRTGDIGVKTGSESANPSPPGPDVDCLPLARLHLRPGMASIKNVDDGVNGYITDVRPILS